MPSHGRFIGASSLPMNEYQRKPGESVGDHWRIPSTLGKRVVRHVIYDTNNWKSFVAARWLQPMGDVGCLSVFGGAPDVHRMFADHCTAEYRVRTQGRGRQVDEWKLRPSADNHWFDCLVGCAVAASMIGVSLPGSQSKKAKEVKRVSWADQQRAAQQRKNQR